MIFNMMAGGVDTSDTTLTTPYAYYGKTFYDKEGNKVTGTMKTHVELWTPDSRVESKIVTVPFSPTMVSLIFVGGEGSHPSYEHFYRDRSFVVDFMSWLDGSIGGTPVGTNSFGWVYDEDSSFYPFGEYHYGAEDQDVDDPTVSVSGNTVTLNAGDHQTYNYFRYGDLLGSGYYVIVLCG